MDIFISWSGKLSKCVAKTLSDWLDGIFVQEEIDIFFSDTDIASGVDWNATVKEKLILADFAIICLTRQNASAPWIHFEAGAIVVGEEKRPAAPLLIDLTKNDLPGALKSLQAIELNAEGIKKLVQDIRKKGKFLTLPDQHLDSILRDRYPILEAAVKNHIQVIEESYNISEFTIFPSEVTMVKKNKVFVGAPMASLESAEYGALRENVLRLCKCIEDECKFEHVYYPGRDIEDAEHFDGPHKALSKDFQELKESQFYVFVFPKKLASSVLLEMGYAICLSKPTLIFAFDKKDLPFMLRQADKALSNVKIYMVDSFEEIIDTVKRNGAVLFSS